jgi:NADH-quinone oxidoreductase subunit M
MGSVVLGLGVWSARDFVYNSDYWNMGVQGAMFQMIAHGISSSGMFFMVGVVYDRVHHRNLDEFGGLFGRMPVYTALSIGIFFAGLGLPGLCGFWGEAFVVLSVYKFSTLLAVISAAVVILTAGYILWAIQRVYLGSEYKGPHGDHLTPSNARENTIAGVLFVAAILFGIFPYHLCFRYLQPAVTHQVQQLAQWTKRVEFAEPVPQPATVSATTPSAFPRTGTDGTVALGNRESTLNSAADVTQPLLSR